MFSAIFVFQKSYTGNILGIGRIKSRSFYFSRHETESKAETEGDQGPAPPFRLYILLGEENLKPDQFSMKHTARRRRLRCKIGRVQKLFLAPCRRGELPPKDFFITMPASGVMRE
jgi:hypothetical protein